MPINNSFENTNEYRILVSRDCKINCVMLQQNSILTRLFIWENGAFSFGKMACFRRPFLPGNLGLFLPTEGLQVPVSGCSRQAVLVVLVSSTLHWAGHPIFEMFSAGLHRPTPPGGFEGRRAPSCGGQRRGFRFGWAVRLSVRPETNAATRFAIRSGSGSWGGEYRWQTIGTSIAGEPLGARRRQRSLA